MEFFNGAYNNIAAFFVIAPVAYGHGLACGAIHNLPPSFDIISCVYGKHIRIKMIHKMNFKLFFNCRVERCHNIHLLNFIRICLCPGIILSCGVIGGIDFCARVFKLLGEFRAVAITNCICAPNIHNFNCFLNHIHIGGYCYSSSFFIHRFTSLIKFIFQLLCCF